MKKLLFAALILVFCSCVGDILPTTRTIKINAECGSVIHITDMCGALLVSGELCQMSDITIQSDIYITVEIILSDGSGVQDRIISNDLENFLLKHLKN